MLIGDPVLVLRHRVPRTQPCVKGIIGFHQFNGMGGNGSRQGRSVRVRSVGFPSISIEVNAGQKDQTVQPSVKCKQLIALVRQIVQIPGHTAGGGKCTRWRAADADHCSGYERSGPRMHPFQYIFASMRKGIAVLSGPAIIGKGKR